MSDVRLIPPHPRPPRRRARIALGVALALIADTLAAQARPTVEELAARVQALEARLGDAPAEAADGAAPASLADLDQRLRVLERRLELQAEDQAAKAARDPVVALSTKGLSIKSPDGVDLRLRGVVQADGRFFVGDEANRQNDGFFFRRIRPSFEGSWGPLVGFRLTPEFAGDSATIVDAYVDLKFDPRATVRIGKVKGPVGLERLQSANAIALAERAFPTELAPNRDLGVQLQGEFAGSGLSYVAGVYNGAPDGRDASTTNADNEFEFAGRVFWEPFRDDANALSGLGIGLAGSTGETRGTGNAFLPRYRTPGQVQFFGYGSNVAANGRRQRLSPQAWYYTGPVGLLAEYITSEQEVRVVSGPNIGRTDALRHRAWQLTGSWVLTGEDASYRGIAQPNRPFASGADGWGALELVARVGALDVDDDAFPVFANLATSASEARAWSVGLNWVLTRNLKLVANYSTTTFERGAATGDREDERVVTTRAQFAF